MLPLMPSLNLSTLGVLGLLVSLCNILLFLMSSHQGLLKIAVLSICLFSCLLCGKHHLKKM